MFLHLNESWVNTMWLINCSKIHVIQFENNSNLISIYLQITLTENNPD